MKKTPKPPKFNFEKLRTDATSANPEIRKGSFKEYFEQFEEFPSYLFDNSVKIDVVLFQTIEDIRNDPETPAKMQKGIEALLERLPVAEDISPERM